MAGRRLSNEAPMPDTRAVKDPAEWTADEIAAIIPKVLDDAQAVETLLRMLATRDPHRAQQMIDAIELGLTLAAREDPTDA